MQELGVSIDIAVTNTLLGQPGGGILVGRARCIEITYNLPGYGVKRVLEPGYEGI